MSPLAPHLHWSCPLCTLFAAEDLAADEAPAPAAAAKGGGGGGGRSSVTLGDLMSAGVIAPGQGVISVTFKRQVFTADLAADAAIECEGKKQGLASSLFHCFMAHAMLLVLRWPRKSNCAAVLKPPKAAAALPAGKRFTSCTAFSIHCKRKLTPGKQVGAGAAGRQRTLPSMPEPPYFRCPLRPTPNRATMGGDRCTTWGGRWTSTERSSWPPAA